MIQRSKNGFRRQQLQAACEFDSGFSMIENQQREFIKQTMLKHEDTFRHQVRELHRLYNVQKHLMSATRSEAKQHIHRLDQRAKFDINNVDLGIISGFDLSRPSEEDMSCGDSSGIIHDVETEPNDVELTLSIGPSTSKTRSKSRHHQTQGNDMTKTSLANSSTLYNQDNKRPHWLFSRFEFK